MIKLKPEKVTIKPNGSSIKYYKEKGYVWESGSELVIDTKDLPPSSTIKVTRVCVDCGDEKLMRRVKCRERCRKCGSVKRGNDVKDPTKTTCPKCGNPKSYDAKECVNCVDRSGAFNGMLGKKNPGLALRNKNRKPEEHWNWKGGISKDRGGKVIAWAKEVKERDVCCQVCGFSNPLALDAHHLESYDHKPKLRYSVSNGVCLCKNCHTIFHKTYGFGNNTTQQYLEFKEANHG